MKEATLESNEFVQKTNLKITLGLQKVVNKWALLYVLLEPDWTYYYKSISILQPLVARLEVVAWSNK